MAFTSDTSPDEIARLIQQGIAKDLEALIRAKLHEVVDPIVSELARDLASKTSVRVHQYTSATDLEQRIVLAFNNKDVNYEAPRTTRPVHEQDAESSGGHPR